MKINSVSAVQYKPTFTSFLPNKNELIEQVKDAFDKGFATLPNQGGDIFTPSAQTPTVIIDRVIITIPNGDEGNGENGSGKGSVIGGAIGAGVAGVTTGSHFENQQENKIDHEKISENAIKKTEGNVVNSTVNDDASVSNDHDDDFGDGDDDEDDGE